MIPMILSRHALLLGIACAAALVSACSDDLPTSARQQSGSVASKATNDTAISTATRLLNPSASLPARDSVTGAPFDPEFIAYNFPERLALSDAQKTSIRTLRTAHAAATASDSTAYLGILEQARVARAAGKPAAEIDAILASAAPIAERLRVSRVKFEADLQSVLTAAQREWLEQCRNPVPPTAAQQRQIQELEAAYTRDNAADLATVQAALTEINAIRADSSSYNSPAAQEKVRQILERVRPARERLSTAQRTLGEKVKAVLGVTACSR